MSPSTFKYFAYGSNMPSARLRARCPSARPICMAELPEYALRWHKRSKDGSGKCDIVGANGSSVMGVLYRIETAEKQALDQAEGLGHGYDEISIGVLIDGVEVAAVAYQATDVDENLKPYSWYHAFVMAGAREHGFPQAYIEQLSTVATSEDPDRSRHDKSMRLIEEASQ